jgi:hypothetical protein
LEPKKAPELEETSQLIEELEAAEQSAGWKASYSSLAAGAIHDDDALLVLDESDTSMAGTGTQKYYLYSSLINDIDNFDIFGFPYGTNPTVDENSEAATDTTDDQLLVYIDALRVYTYKHRFCFTLEDPADADDDIPLFSHDDAITIFRLDCRVEGGTSAVVVLNDGTNNLDSMTCGTTETSDASMSANNTFTALEQVEADVGTVTGTVDWVRFCFSYTIDRE